MATAPRLPGIRFETEPPPPTVILPRMDVAAFVGFACTGPLHIPVAVDDAAHFEEVFGPDAPLAWDPDLGEEATAYLGPAVRAFFRNGGRRCWVVRVADTSQAQTNHFPLAGMVAVSGAGAIGAAALEARSPGSATDGLRVALAVAPEPIRLWLTDSTGAVPGTIAFEALVVSPGDVNAGDTIRVDFAGSAWSLVFAVTDIQVSDAATGSPPAGSRLLAVSGTGNLAYWMRIAPVAEGTSVSLLDPGLPQSPPIDATLSSAGTDGQVQVPLALQPAQAPPPGAVVEASTGTGTLWLSVDDVQATDTTTALIATPYEISLAAPDPVPVQAAGAFAERLTLELRVTDEQGATWTLDGLGLAPAHPRFVGDLPSDAALFAGGGLPNGPLAQAVASPRFPLAGPAPGAALYLPLGASILVGPTLGPVPTDTPQRVRDGLAQFSGSLFLDPRLATTSDQTLLAEANWIRYQAPDPPAGQALPEPWLGAPDSRTLAGVHALLGNDEVTLVAAPDAVNRAWSASPLSSALPLAGEISPPALSPPAGAQPAPAFEDCATVTVAPPQFDEPPAPEAGVYKLSWTDAGSGVVYELQEADDPSFVAASTVYKGTGLTFALYGRAPGASLYYRVRAAEPVQSAWSDFVAVLIGARDRFVLDAVELYTPADLELVHTAMLRMCCARGDMLAVLALPEHYGARDAVSYARALGGGGAWPGPAAPALSYGAVYHPWLYTADAANPTNIRRAPPDGPACGVIAASANALGAWVAPANVALQDVVALDRAIPAEALLALKSARVNVLRQRPDGFLWLSADTLSVDDELRPIGVRRLLSALRRIAVLQGAAFAFEPNSDVLRRAIQREFEGILGDMFTRGAFAEGTAATAYRVNVGSPPNTATSVEEGRLIVELAVAPSRPLAFLTIRLLRAGDGTLQVQAG